MEGTEFKGMSDRSEYQESVAKALDMAIAKAAKAELCRLSAKLNEDKVEIARAVENALRGLAGLQGGNQPRYNDEWLALLYSTWYQPSHINLAYSMIKAMVKQRRDPEGAVLSPTGKLHVVDFGCGTLAMQFGVALAAADALQQGQTLTSIKIDLIDSSQPMIDFGLKIWRQFEKEVERNEQLAKLSETCDLIRTKTLAIEENPKFYRRYSRWISAMHVVYCDNKDDVKKELHRLSKETDPHVGFFTYHYRSSFLVKSVSPFTLKKYKNFKTEDPFLLTESLSSTYSSKIWRVRYDLYDHISGHFEDDYFVCKYLTQNIPWEPSGADCLVYTKRQYL